MGARVALPRDSVSLALPCLAFMRIARPPHALATNVMRVRVYTCMTTSNAHRLRGLPPSSLG
jgi:hypothetical protein